MTLVPLVEHECPRVMMLDFSERDVKKFQEAGFEAKRGATGVLANDQDKFLFPYPTQDTEVIFAQVQVESFAPPRHIKREAHPDSAEKEFFFRDLVREVWERAGWTIFFVKQGCRPSEFSSVGIEYVGVLAYEKKFDPASYALSVKEQKGVNGEAQLRPAEIPIFSGHNLHTNSSEPECIVLDRYIKQSKKSVVTCWPNDYDYSLHRCFLVFDYKSDIEYLAHDSSTNRSVVAAKLKQRVYADRVGNTEICHDGGMLFLPDFGENNVNVALALMQEVIPIVSPHLFDTPQHSWLEKYQPSQVLQLEKEKEDFIEKAHERLAELDARADEIRQEFAWLPGLLIHTGPEFESDVAQALRYLGFDVDEVDGQIQSKERRKEDFHIRHPEMNYFAIGEAKTTGKGRGAAEDFITKTQTHQNRYAHEHKQPPPRALLFVNYAIDLEPSRRSERFYQNDLQERLEDNAITAVDSVALWELCQAVQRDEITQKKAREIIISESAFIRSGVLNL